MIDDNGTVDIDNEMMLGMRAQSLGRNQNELVQEMRALAPELVDAYIDTDFIVDPDGTKSLVRINESVPLELTARLESSSWASWAIISACNPHSETLPEQENQRRHQLLAQLLLLQGLGSLPAVGRSKDCSWEEPSLFVGGIDYEMARAVGMCFQQNAIVFSEINCPVELVFCAA